MKSKSSLAFAAAALTGMVAGSATMAFGAPTAAGRATVGTAGVKTMADAPKDKGDKHACKGQNACKGQGGCKTEKNSCKGQNACKGQGGCKTTDEKPADKKPEEKKPEEKKPG